MATNKRRKFRAPVISRLTLAWIFFATVGALATGLAFHMGQRQNGPARVAVALTEPLERFAREEISAQGPERPPEAADASVPSLREPDLGEEPFYVEGEDALADATTAGAPMIAEEDRLIQPSEIIITIDGAPAPAPGAKVIDVRLASVQRAGIRIPDPDPALLQRSTLGSIPKIANDGRRAARVYARPFDNEKDTPVAVIVGGLGLNPALTARVIDDLPPEVTLSFAPYAKDLEFWTKKARDDGHEVMIEIPMEGYGAQQSSLGPAALTTDRTDAENLQRLDWILSRFGGYFAATNYLGGKFSADRASLSAVISRLESLGVAYIDDTGAARRAVGDKRNLGAVNRMIGAAADDKDGARRDLNALQSLAAQNGGAIGKAYAYDATIEAISEWIEAQEGGPVTLAPASAVLRKQRAAG